MAHLTGKADIDMKAGDWRKAEPQYLEAASIAEQNAASGKTIEGAFQLDAALKSLAACYRAAGPARAAQAKDLSARRVAAWRAAEARLGTSSYTTARIRESEREK